MSTPTRQVTFLHQPTTVKKVLLERMSKNIEITAAFCACLNLGQSSFTELQVKLLYYLLTFSFCWFPGSEKDDQVLFHDELPHTG